MMEKNPDENLFEELSKAYEEETNLKLPDAKKYTKGQDIYIQGHVPKGVYYIKSGSVKITHNNHEAPVVVRLARKHELIGYLSLLKHWDYNSTATAVETTEVYFIPKQFFFRVVQSNIKFANAILDILCTRMHEQHDLLTDVLTKSVQERLAVLLLTLDHSQANGQINYFKKDIAAILNIKAETLSRNLLRLQKIGAITQLPKTGTIEILSKEKLLRLTHVTD